MDDGIMDGSAGMSPRKAMGEGKGAGGGNFGCSPLSSHSKPHPDAKSGVHKKTMKDGERGIGKPVSHSSGKLPSQRNVDHGRHG